jgi:hypothetical protein
MYTWYMNIQEAKHIYTSWQDLIEIDIKLGVVFNKLPVSFLPYPKDVLLMAISVLSEDLKNAGNLKMLKNIEENAANLNKYVADEVALTAMHNMLEVLESDNEFKKSQLNTLDEVKTSWYQHKGVEILENETEFYITDEDVVLAVRKMPNGIIRETVVLTGHTVDVGTIRYGAGSPVSKKAAYTFLIENYQLSKEEAIELFKQAIKINQ